MSKEMPNKKACNNRVSKSNLCEEINAKKSRKSISNSDEDDGITLSKQLSKKKNSRSRNTQNINRSTMSRICPNGKPMPSLTELEKMYEDSDDEGINSTPKVTPTISPESAQQIASRLMATLSNISWPDELLDMLPAPPIVPQKKPKKSGKPYIIGCKDRTQVISKPKTNWAQGDKEYGVLVNAAGPEDLLDTPQKRSKQVNLSKSIFNAQGDAIARALTENEYVNESSTDSNKTITYFDDNNNGTSPSSTSSITKSFTPLPSTSKDCQTILKNEQHFFECLKNEISNLEIIEIPCETVDISSKTIDIPRETIDISCETINIPCMQSCNEIIDIDKTEFINKNGPIKKHTYDDYGDDVQVVEPEVSKKHEDNCNNTKMYKDIQINETYDLEVIDVDDVIADNKVITEKYCQPKKVDTICITDVKPTHSHTPKKQTNTSDSSPEMQATRSIVLPSKNNEITKNITSIASNNSRNVNSEQINVLTNDAPSDGITNIPRSTTIKSTTLDTSNSRALIQPEEQSGDIHFIDLTQMPPRADVKRKIQKQCSETNKSLNKNKLPTQTSTSAGAVRSFGDCPICMDTIGINSIASTMCGHVFCLNCIQIAIRTSGKKCPTCRKNLKGVGYHQLFL